MIFDLKKYKHDYFISTLSGSTDSVRGRFGSPTGITTLDDDLLLVANFSLDTLLIVDIKGAIHQIYRDIYAPKDLIRHPLASQQAVVATRKELVILDLSTSQIVARTDLKGFYPWCVQYLHGHETFAGKLFEASSHRSVELKEALGDVSASSEIAA